MQRTLAPRSPSVRTRHPTPACGSEHSHSGFRRIAVQTSPRRTVSARCHTPKPAAGDARTPHEPTSPERRSPFPCRRPAGIVTYRAATAPTAEQEHAERRGPQDVPPRWTENPPLHEGHEFVLSARIAVQTDESLREDAAFQKLPQFSFNGARYVAALPLLPREKGL